MGAFRPLEATARASAQFSAKSRANFILPLSLYQKVHLNVTAMQVTSGLGQALNLMEFDNKMMEARKYARTLFFSFFTQA